ncbi:MAG TPA: poly-gamma-glutamate biosynthesis protein PgsC [Thermotogota bacterium]|nr:poly-gamma-glutamate biosynthesis protein PgsC [Thermotogota bacterium]HRW93163.1 poly-gamma-glutamate biosynthesis protein PgsC [Thermotogota bacterium]
MNITATLIGVLLASGFVELTGLYPGGIVVPVYLALYLHQPYRILGTLLIALTTAGLVRLLSYHLVLFGRRRFVTMLSLGGLLTYLWATLLPSLFPGNSWLPSGLELQAIGWIIPGLWANVIERQGVWKTLASTAIVSIVVYFLLRGISLVW